MTVREYHGSVLCASQHGVLTWPLHKTEGQSTPSASEEASETDNHMGSKTCYSNPSITRIQQHTCAAAKAPRLLYFGALTRTEEYFLLSLRLRTPGGHT